MPGSLGILRADMVMIEPKDGGHKRSLRTRCMRVRNASCADGYAVNVRCSDWSE